MTTKNWSLTINRCMFGALLSCLVSSSLAQASVYVISIGSNQSFDARTKKLNYAARDASEFAKTMREVGAIPKSSIITAIDTKLEDFEASLDAISKQFAKDPDISVSKFVFFFSGHSDERGLHFRNGFFSKNALEQYLSKLKVRTKVVILDSCFSGLMSAKGVRESKTFELPRLNFDEPTGSIFLTATTSQDFAFESRKLKGGLFSRSVIDGLNGKADTNNDGVVTATELYEYAFRETQFTSRLLPAPTMQTPEFVANLKGHGAIALAFPTSARGNIRFTSDLGGSIKLYAAKGISTFEHLKPKGQDDTVVLPTGHYSMQVKDGSETGNANIDVTSGLTQLVTKRDVAWNAAGASTESDISARGSMSSSLQADQTQHSYRASIAAAVWGPGNYYEASLAKEHQDIRLPLLTVSKHGKLLPSGSIEGAKESIGISLGMAAPVSVVSNWLHARYLSKLHWMASLGAKNVSIAKVTRTEQRYNITHEDHNYTNVWTSHDVKNEEKTFTSIRAGLELSLLNEHVVVALATEQWFDGLKQTYSAEHGLLGLGGVTVGLVQKF